jgi:hypothetical protein
VIELRAHDWEGFLYLTNLLREGGAGWEPVGGNVVRVDGAQLDGLTAELRAEIVRVADGLPPVSDPHPTSTDSTPADPPGAGVGELPPRAGPGASRAAWAAAAEARGLPVASSESRDDLIKKVDTHDGR